MTSGLISQFSIRQFSMNFSNVFMSRFFITAVLVLGSLFSFSQRAIPALEGKRVHDEAQVLSGQTIQQLESQLKQHEDSTSNQLAILIITSLEGDAIEEYALSVAEKWELGQKEKDNGAFLLIATDDRKMRIEVGYGLEGALTDAVCAQIIRNEMAPNFRRGDYDAGVLLAVNAMVRAIGGEYVADDSTGGNAPMTGKEKALIGLFVFGILGVFTFMGLASEGAPGWVLYFFLIPFYAVFPGAIFGWGLGLSALGIYLLAFPVLKTIFKKMGWSKKFASTRSRSGGGWSSGSGWFGGGSSGGSSWGGGGGFSGGGGSFGGGGSSGSW